MRFLLLATVVCVCHIEVNQSDTISDVKTEVEEVKTGLRGVATKLNALSLDLSGYITAVRSPVLLKLLPKLEKIGIRIGNSTRKQGASIRKQDVSLGLQFLSFTILVIYVLAISICKCVETVKQKQADQMEEAVEKVELKMLERQKLLRRKQKSSEVGGSMA